MSSLLDYSPFPVWTTWGLVGASLAIALAGAIYASHPARRWARVKITVTTFAAYSLLLLSILGLSLWSSYTTDKGFIEFQQQLEDGNSFEEPSGK